MIDIKKDAKIQDLYNYYYMISLYNLIKFYNCKWEFLSINDKNFLNGTNLKYDDFSVNKYLRLYQNEKIKLAEDIINNGMYFPYFVYGLPEEQIDDNSVSIALGKHRYYSKLLYQNKYGKIDTKFLFIYIPSKLPRNTPTGFNNCFYNLDHKGNLTLHDTIFVNSKTELIKYFDRFGGYLSVLFSDDKIKTNPILNDEHLFEKFINAPLDENNILFTYCNKDN